MTKDQRQLAVVVAIVVIGVVLGLTVSGFFLILLAGPVVVLVQYVWQNDLRTAGPPTSSRELRLPDKAALPERFVVAGRAGHRNFDGLSGAGPLSRRRLRLGGVPPRTEVERQIRPAVDGR